MRDDVRVGVAFNCRKQFLVRGRRGRVRNQEPIKLPCSDTNVTCTNPAVTYVVGTRPRVRNLRKTEHKKHRCRQCPMCVRVC